MKRLVILLLCLSLGVFTAARAMKPAQTLAAIAETAQKMPTGEQADAKAEEQEIVAEEDADEGVASSDDDSVEDASDEEGEDMSDDDTSDDDNGEADDSGIDDAGDDASDDGGD
jgi:ribonuclease E